MNEQDADERTDVAEDRRSKVGWFRRLPLWARCLQGVCLIVVIGAIGSWFVALEAKHGNVVKFDDGSVYYTHPVTEAQARRIGEIFTRASIPRTRRPCNSVVSGTVTSCG